jgi:hypothetical protein
MYEKSQLSDWSMQNQRIGQLKKLPSLAEVSNYLMQTVIKPTVLILYFKNELNKYLGHNHIS